MKLYSLLLLLPVLAGCVPDLEPRSNLLESSRGSTAANDAHTSSVSGTSCSQASCHDGIDAAAFTLSGTLYSYTNLNATLNNAAIELYSEPHGSGELLASIDVDDNGNFYSNRTFTGNGVEYYPVVYDRSLAKRSYKPIPSAPLNASTLQCNSCHGNAVSATDANGQIIATPTVARLNNGNFSNTYFSGSCATCNIQGTVLNAGPRTYVAIGFYNRAWNTIGNYNYDLHLAGVVETTALGDFYSSNLLPPTWYGLIASYDSTVKLTATYVGQGSIPYRAHSATDRVCSNCHGSSAPALNANSLIPVPN
ncbi:MAG: hypothetical protein OEZ68_05790 [Gammaproteobacteria bacterium]|nr:hypothetical protein [Gammaproteobacteria bacterium]MDH5800299.1 hypothetical protein [Gammaproteobacteria bacterium]